ncbi:glucokinase [Nocardioides baekrokdamisoli]|uniref:Glucokinase n=1 Tax=Nocardioides baekrokdamisoli TaxID=1804624 RepID=A0A3G9J5M7_9ACTN|nr:ROK family protein [Nocardioides baekrokdamisoli]BBH18299.1 glucokinase [Nocardioides baekrokdamisoli]
MTLTCGVDVGGTKILAAVVDAGGCIVEEVRIASPAGHVEAMIESIAGVVGDLAGRHQIDAVGIGAAGYIDKSRSRVLFAPNIAWRNLDLKAEIEARIDLPVVVENDGNAAAWGEFRFGAGRDVEDMVMVTVGTGVGGGIVINGELVRGAYGVAAEIGHLTVVPDGDLCGCGKRGCLEAYASGTALERRVPGMSGPEITAAARAGDQRCIEAIAGIGRWLGGGLASLAAVLDPGRIVVGGGVAEAGDLLLDPVREAFRTHLTGVGYRPEAEIVSAALGNHAGVIGAADVARS